MISLRPSLFPSFTITFTFSSYLCLFCLSFPSFVWHSFSVLSYSLSGGAFLSRSISCCFYFSSCLCFPKFYLLWWVYLQVFNSVFRIVFFFSYFISLLNFCIFYLRFFVDLFFFLCVNNLSVCLYFFAVSVDTFFIIFPSLPVFDFSSFPLLLSLHLFFFSSYLCAFLSSLLYFQPSSSY